MKQVLLFHLLFLSFFNTLGQTFTTDPQFPAADSPITITVDVTGTSLENYTGDVWIWTWISEGCSTGCDAPTNVNPATEEQSAAKVNRIGTNIYRITFTATDFFDKPADQLQEIGFKLKSANWDDNKQSDKDLFIKFYEADQLSLVLNEPEKQPHFVDHGGSIVISAIATMPSDLTLTIEGTAVKSVENSSSIEYMYTPGSPGKYTFQILAESNGQEATITSYFVVTKPTINEVLPEDVIEGINYDPSDPSKATLVLRAPNKESVYVVGDFTNWAVEPLYQMKKDGELFWIQLTNLTPSNQYLFHYLVNEEVYIADPYSEMVLDPDDHWIPDSQNSSFESYPEEAILDEWYFNRLSVIETGQSPYVWQNEKVQVKPDSLIIYELLIRDFFEDGERSYTNLIDTLDYLKELGVNTVQLMPIMEFNGNESWGYNPTFMFAPDKYYGTKDELKSFIDTAHGKGMAVILDITMNHQDIPNSFLLLDFNFTSFQPTADNKYFNQTATHPFNVFFDMNHESLYTQAYLDTINHYWLNEYKVDGFRFDLSKGFTQKNSGEDVGFWSSYDQSRIDLLKRMADKIRAHSPEAILILEHFAANNEEVLLSDYGFLLWGNMNHSYSQAAMGYADGSIISGVYHKSRGWSKPHLVSYMESHDEERIGYRLKTSGHVSVRENKIALERLKANSVFFYTVPGPKMLWQWGEVGYDRSIEENGRIGIKPIPWNGIDGLDYNNDELRIKLYEFNKEILNLREKYDVFSFGEATFIENALQKQLTIRSHPYTDSPVGPEQMNVVIIGNFDVALKTLQVQFPHIGDWYSYFSPNKDISITSSISSVALEPGEFRIYTDIEIPGPSQPELTIFAQPIAPSLEEVEQIDGQGINIHWQDNSEIEKNYKIMRSEGTGEYEVIATLPSESNNFIDLDVKANNAYSYKIIASGASATSESNEVSITTNQLITAIEDSILLNYYYPNPVSDKLTLELKSAGEIKIYNQLGMLIYSETIPQGYNQIDFGNESKGFYYIHIENPGNTQILKIIKN